jgi:hypothetical protein
MTIPSIGAAKRSVFVSVATYELGKQIGVEAACREFLRQCENPTRNDLPAARMVARLRTLADVGLYHSFGSNLSKMRSRQAHAALTSDFQFWLMMDDDVECDQSTLLRLLATAGDPDKPRAAGLPCLIRGTAEEQTKLNVEWESSLLMAGAGGTCRPAKSIGTGCLVLTRQALLQVTENARTLRLLPWLDDDGVVKMPLFTQLFEANDSGSYAWLGEDISFCRVLRKSGVELLGLTSGWSVHDGQKLELDTLR